MMMKQYWTQTGLADLRAGIVVFFVALPLCLGIALASGAPLVAGMVTGIVAGLLVTWLSGSSLSISGPAAGLTVIVLDGIQRLGSFEAFLFAGLIAGVLQIVLGYCRAGKFRDFIPVPVIYGMLAGIGLIVVLKQIPHLLGVDDIGFGYREFFEFDGRNTLSSLWYALSHIELGVLIVGGASLGILIVWDLPFIRQSRWALFMPGALLVVLLGVLLNILFGMYWPALNITAEHLVALPVAGTLSDLWQGLHFPDVTQWNNLAVYSVAMVIAVIASVESLLSLNAVDTLDPQKKFSPPNRELKAQGMGNVVSSLLGGIPMTAVAIRGSANISAGGKTKIAGLTHGILLLIALLWLPHWINLIPLTTLAAILIVLGYQLAKPRLFKLQWRSGWATFIPFIVTVLAILLSDLLIGIICGLVSHHIIGLASLQRRRWCARQG
jgi:MFS superfamily sulfate permease-like transporter